MPFFTSTHGATLMNAIKNLLISLLLLALSAQVFALDLTQATKDTRFILSDSNKTLRLTFDTWAISLYGPDNSVKNSAGVEINSSIFVRGTGVGASDKANLIVNGLNFGEQYFFKTIDFVLDGDTIDAIKNNKGKDFTLTTGYDASATISSVAIGQADDTATLPATTLTLCWIECSDPANDNPAY